MQGGGNANEDKIEGRVMTYDPNRGWGFLAVAGRGNEGLFVHVNDLAKSGIFKPLKVGQHVRCRIGKSPKSKDRDTAIDIEVIE